ncbi:conserved hypothetical protein [Tenacibaculum dicentrarchi]|nr:conserved hypothetical protein [Tenacibaculum dicentrarchi]
MFDIINTLTEKDVKNDYVAIGTYINTEKIPAHSVLVIKYNNTINHFHFTSKEILYDEVYNNTCFHKITETIKPELIPSFIMMCKRILKKANPRYGYFYSGEYYDTNGIHFSEKTISETMTCSGFCINVLKGFLEKDYIVYTDWNTTSFPTQDYLERFANHFNIDKDKISESHRRISPLELLCSGYFSNLPIKKKHIDLKIDETSEYLLKY